LVFIDNDDNKVIVDQLVDTASADQTKGELLFKVPGNVGIKLKNYINREFFIISIDPGGIESKIYQGIVNIPSEIQTLLAEEKIIANENKNILESRIADLETKLAKKDLQIQEALITNASQGSDPDRIKLKPSSTQGGSLQQSTLAIDIPGMATSNITVSPVQLVRPNDAVIKSKSDKYTIAKDAKK